MMRKFEVVNDKNRMHEDDKVSKPVRGTEKSAGYDFSIPEAITIEPNKKVLVWTDIKAIMPDNEYLSIKIRSSIGMKLGVILSNIEGVIDSDYANNPLNDGNIGIPLWNTSDETVSFKAGERIAQGIFIQYYTTTDDNSFAQRNGGFGHTGKGDVQS